MFIVDVTNAVTLILILAATLLLIYLAQEMKKSYIIAIPLFIFLVLLISHVAQLTTITPEYTANIPVLSRCIVVDFVFILLSFLSYIWVDKLEAKEKGIDGIEDGLDWFWKKI